MNRTMNLSVSNWFGQFNEMSDISLSIVIGCWCCLLKFNCQQKDSFLFLDFAAQRKERRRRKNVNGKCKKTFVEMDAMHILHNFFCGGLLLHANWVNWFTKRNTIHTQDTYRILLAIKLMKQLKTYTFLVVFPIHLSTFFFFHILYNVSHPALHSLAVHSFLFLLLPAIHVIQFSSDAFYRISITVRYACNWQAKLYLLYSSSSPHPPMPYRPPPSVLCHFFCFAFHSFSLCAMLTAAKCTDNCVHTHVQLQRKTNPFALYVKFGSFSLFTTSPSK